MSGQFSSMQFKVDEYYVGKCDEVRTAKLGDSMVMEFGFTIAPDFRDYTKVFLGSDSPGKDGLTNDERCQRTLKEFGCTEAGLNGDAIMSHIRKVMIGQEIQVKAGEYKGNVQFSGCDLPGKVYSKGPNIIETENPFGYKRPKSAATASGNGMI